MFNTIEIPNNGKEPEQAFLDTMDTFMGEYPIKSFTTWESALGTWARSIFETQSENIRAAYFEDENGNITEYFVEDKPNHIIHRFVEV